MISQPISKTNSPLDNAKSIVEAAFQSTKGMTDEERIERISYSIAAIFRDVPLESDGMPMLLIKMNPGRVGSICKVHGDMKDLSVMISKHIDTEEVLKPILMALTLSKNTTVIKI